MSSPNHVWVRRFAWGFFWLLTVFEALGMALAGSGKFTNADLWLTWFVEWGYTESFGQFIGGAEVVGAVLLLVPRLAPYAAAGLIVIMLGATWTVTTRPSRLGVEGGLIHLALLIVILAVRLWDRRRQRTLPTPQEYAANTS